jgi:formylglycine-generating enzyme required for sulfatase activity
LRGLAVAVIGLLIFAMGILSVSYRTAVDTQATAEAEANYFMLRDNRRVTLEAGGVDAPPATLQMMDFLATETQIAALHNLNPVVAEFEGVPMVQIPAGCFFMGSDRGSDDERPSWLQCLNKLWIDQFEVTNEQFARFIEAGIYKIPKEWTRAGWDFVNEMQANEITIPHDYEGLTEPRQPRVGVTWYEAYAYCRWRAARLPTEREWEYAARGPDSLKYPWGNEFMADYVIYAENSAEAADVSSQPAGASWVGANNMSGNVWELTSTIYDAVEGDGETQNFLNEFPYPYRADDGREEIERNDGRKDPAQPDVVRVMRGGSYINNSDISLRAAARNYVEPWNETEAIGFRCVRDDSG